MSWGLATEKWPALAISKIPTSLPSYQTNITDSSRSGTTVTGSASTNTLGNYAELISSTTANSQGLWVLITDMSGSLSNTNGTGLVNIATGAESSESVIVPNLNACGVIPNGTGNIAVTGKLYWLPGLQIASGSRIAANFQSGVGSRTVNVAVFLDLGFNIDISQTTVVTYGATTASSKGTSVTPGNGTFGDWTEIATTSRDHRAWTVGYDTFGDTSVANASIVIQIGYGADAGSVTTLYTSYHTQGASENTNAGFPPAGFGAVDSGTKVWARIASAETEARGIIIYGV